MPEELRAPPVAQGFFRGTGWTGRTYAVSEPSASAPIPERSNATRVDLVPNAWCSTWRARPTRPPTAPCGWWSPSRARPSSAATPRSATCTAASRSRGEHGATTRSITLHRPAQLLLGAHQQRRLRQAVREALRRWRSRRARPYLRSSCASSRASSTTSSAVGANCVDIGRAHTFWYYLWTSARRSTTSSSWSPARASRPRSPGSAA